MGSNPILAAIRWCIEYHHIALLLRPGLDVMVASPRTTRIRGIRARAVEGGTTMPSDDLVHRQEPPAPSHGVTPETDPRSRRTPQPSPGRPGQPTDEPVR